jgi:hypothetical protein
MIHYKDLPDEVASAFLQDIDLSPVSYRSGFQWVFVNTNDCLTSTGKQWFKDRNIIVYEQAMLFKAESNSEHPLHTDGEFLDAAFNFVLNKQGELQWAADIESDIVIAKNVVNQFTFTRYQNVKKMTVIDKWSGHAGLVRIGQPHRVVTYSEPRFCLSIRPVPFDSVGSEFKFDELVNLF